jgi:hypothetical protein
MSIWVRHACAVPTRGCEEPENGAHRRTFCARFGAKRTKPASAPAAALDAPANKDQGSKLHPRCRTRLHATLRVRCVVRDTRSRVRSRAGPTVVSSEVPCIAQLGRKFSKVAVSRAAFPPAIRPDTMSSRNSTPSPPHGAALRSPRSYGAAAAASSASPPPRHRAPLSPFNRAQHAARAPGLRKATWRCARGARRAGRAGGGASCPRRGAGAARGVRPRFCRSP